MYRGIILMSSLIVVSSRQTDERWLQQPEGHVKVIGGSSLQLEYEYTKPPGTPTGGKLYFAHHMPQHQHENILIEAKLNPTNGTVTVLYEMFPGKVRVTSDGRQVTISVKNLTLDEGGRYLTDVNFDTDAALHDVVVVSVFEKPIICRSHKQVIIENEGNYITLGWNFKSAASSEIPDIISISVSHLNGNGKWAEFINHERNQENQQWQLTYPDDSGHFRERVSYAPGPKSERVQLTLWDIKSSDKGQYKIHVRFEDDVTILEDNTTLHVTAGCNWRTAPDTKTLIAESQELRLRFTPDDDNFTASNKTFQLIKKVNQSESVYASLKMDQSGWLSASVEGPCVGRWIANYVNHSQSVLLSVSTARVEDGGSYRAILMDAGNIVLQHDFNITVLKIGDLKPIIQSNLSDLYNVSQVEVKINDGLPRANISMFDMEDNESGELLHQANETKFVHTLLPALRGNNVSIKIQVDYIHVVHQEVKVISVPTQGIRDATCPANLKTINISGKHFNAFLTLQSITLAILIVLVIINIIAIYVKLKGSKKKKVPTATLR